MMLGSHSCGYRCIYITNMYIQFICYAYNYDNNKVYIYIAYMYEHVFVYCDVFLSKIILAKKSHCELKIDQVCSSKTIELAIE